MDETLTLEFDGGSRGNPGPAGIGVVVRAKDGTPLVTLGRFIGRATNNVAEYKALITAMEEAKKTRREKHRDPRRFGADHQADEGGVSRQASGHERSL
jgi:ribonuclease HI